MQQALDWLPCIHAASDQLLCTSSYHDSSAGYPPRLTTVLDAWISANPHNDLADRYRQRRLFVKVPADPDCKEPELSEVRAIGLLAQPNATAAAPVTMLLALTFVR
jgi:hypothetical protein